MDINQHKAMHKEESSHRGRSKQNSLIKALTANDIIVWGGDAFIGVVLALFVVDFIDGATALHVGLALMILRVTNAVAAIPLGRFFDEHKGYRDEVWGLTIATFMYGVLYLLLGFSSHIWQLYTIMFFFGIARTLDISSWRILFYGHIDKSHFGQVTGMYQTLFSFGIGLCMSLGGFAGDYFGYDKVLIFGGLFIMMGSFLPPLIKGYLPKTEL